MIITTPPFRASAPLTSMMGTSQFGSLIDLAGTWMGKGFNLVSLPRSPKNTTSNPSEPRFAPKIAATNEVLVFAPLGAPVPNRGFVDEDIFLFGLTYLQVVSDAASLSARHFETGLWLNVPDSPPPNVVRQAVIPHGDSLLARGAATQASAPPQIGMADSRPIDVSSGNVIVSSQYLDPFKALVLPPEIPQGSIDDPNKVLREIIKSQNITSTVTIDVTTAEEGGGILNIPFVKANAEVRSMQATFWIETIVPDNQTPFVQLQYSQAVVLRFDGVDWPHISVGTLIRQ